MKLATVPASAIMTAHDAPSSVRYMTCAWCPAATPSLNCAQAALPAQRTVVIQSTPCAAGGSENDADHVAPASVEWKTCVPPAAQTSAASAAQTDCTAAGVDTSDHVTPPSTVRTRLPPANGCGVGPDVTIPQPAAGLTKSPATSPPPGGPP